MPKVPTDGHGKTSGSKSPEEKAPCRFWSGFVAILGGSPLVREKHFHIDGMDVGSSRREVTS
jgi:hypothetical protein